MKGNRIGSSVLIYDIIGIGAGPSNLSLAALSSENIKAVYIERETKFSWFEGMEFSFADLQVSYIKDLVSLADPTNSYSFLNYLHCKNKLLHFINAKFDSISRKEYADYLGWVFNRLPCISTGEAVVSIDFDDDFIVTTNKRTLRGKNISIGVGKIPYIPEFSSVHIGDKNFSITEYKRNEKSIAGSRVLIVGGGQSGAEVFYEMIKKEKDEAPQHVYWVSSRENFQPMDDSPFANDLYLPCHIDFLGQLTQGQKDKYIRDNTLASDGISEKTLKDIYQLLYKKRFVDYEKPSCTLLPGREVKKVTKDGQRWTVDTTHKTLGIDEEYKADVIIWANGLKYAPKKFLKPIDSLISKIGDEYLVDENYAAVWQGPKDRNIFLLNSVRSQKGLSDPNLSLMAWRSRKILDKIEDKKLSNIVNKSLVQWGESINEEVV